MCGLPPLVIAAIWGSQLWCARRVFNVRTSSLSSLVVLGSRNLPHAMCGQCSHVLAVIACCSRGRTLPRAMCGQCHRVVACGCRGSDPFATTVAAMWGHGLTSSLSSLAIVGDRTLLLYYRRMCGQCSHVITDGSSVVIVGDRTLFITTIESMCGQCPHVMTGCHRL